MYSGAYAQAVEAGGFLFVSGQIPLCPRSGEVMGTTIGNQTRQILENLIAILTAADMKVEHLVKKASYLAGITDFADFNTVYEDVLGETCPARSVVAVAGLPKNVRVEIEAVSCR